MSDAKDLAAREEQLVAEQQADAGAEHIALVYARALLGASEKAGVTDTLMEEFDALVSELLNGYPRLEAILVSAIVGYEEKTAVLDRLLSSRISPMLLNFLKILSRRGRLDCLRGIHRQTRMLFDQLRGRVPVQVSTAVPVDADALARLTAGLHAAIGGEPVMSLVVRPELIGGAVVRVGDMVYDGSIAGQLQVLRQQMIDRSVHEIQSRRDRFRNPV
jgi:F-type H+-transporting ATPase subunit delta